MQRTKKISQCACAALFISLIAFSALARGGGFYADRETGIYHAYTHARERPADEMKMVAFDTPEEAEAAGYKPCEICNPSGPANKTSAHQHR